MKLISNTSFGKLCKSKEKELKTRLEYLEWYEKTRNNFDLFVEKNLKLEMFVPCDEDGNVLEFIEYETWIGTDEEYNLYIESYHKAKEKVLFKNTFEYKDAYYINNLINNETIESALKLDGSIELTENAIKQIGL